MDWVNHPFKLSGALSVWQFCCLRTRLLLYELIKGLISHLKSLPVKTFFDYQKSSRDRSTWLINFHNKIKDKIIFYVFPIKYVYLTLKAYTQFSLTSLCFCIRLRQILYNIYKIYIMLYVYKKQWKSKA